MSYRYLLHLSLRHADGYSRPPNEGIQCDYLLLLFWHAWPRPGWEFEGWENCQHAHPQTQYCSFSVPAKTVQGFWGNTAPPLVAYFTESSAAVPPIKDLYDATTNLEPAQQISTASALITRFADRARDRHAREDEFHSYVHYLSFCWEHRTAAVEIVDAIGRGGNTITFNVTTQWKLNPNEAELRFFYRGINTVAEHHNNGAMTRIARRSTVQCGGVPRLPCRYVSHHCVSSPCGTQRSDHSPLH